MGNQYSITVSDETHHILKQAKKDGYKVSQLIDVAVKTLGREQLLRLRMVWKSYEGDEEWSQSSPKKHVARSATRRSRHINTMMNAFARLVDQWKHLSALPRQLKRGWVGNERLLQVRLCSNVAGPNQVVQPNRSRWVHGWIKSWWLRRNSPWWGCPLHWFSSRWRWCCQMHDVQSHVGAFKWVKTSVKYARTKCKWISLMKFDGIGFAGIVIAMKTIEVQCAMCGHREIIELKYPFNKGKHSEPDIWICNTHR